MGIMIRRFFNRDSWSLGIILGIVVPLLIFGLLAIFEALFSNGPDDKVFRLSTRIVIAVFCNLIPFRHYMVKLKFDKTGRGILLDTFVFAIVFFIFFLDDLIA
jgi:hypothetical protein